MKKALVVLLLLAMVGGGLFAQSVTWSGSVDGGIGMTKMDGDDDLHWGVNGYTAETNGTRVRLSVNAVNADENAGVTARVQATGGVNGDFPGTIVLNQAEAWVKGFDGMLTLRGGRLATWDISSAYGSTFDGGMGLVTYVKPLPMFSAGFGLLPTFAVNTDSLLFEDIDIWGAVKVDLGLALVTAHLKKSASTDASLSVSVSALPGFDIGAYATITALDEFSDAGIMDFGAAVDFSVAGLDIGVWGDASKSNVDGQDDLFVGVGADFAFPIGNITPSLGVAYGMAAVDQAWYKEGLHHAWWDPSYNADQSILSIGPKVSIAVNKATLLFGGVVNKDLNLAASGSKDEGMNFGAFVNLNVAF